MGLAGACRALGPPPGGAPAGRLRCLKWQGVKSEVPFPGSGMLATVLFSIYFLSIDISTDRFWGVPNNAFGRMAVYPL